MKCYLPQYWTKGRWWIYNLKPQKEDVYIAITAFKIQTAWTERSGKEKLKAHGLMYIMCDVKSLLSLWLYWEKHRLRIQTDMSVNAFDHEGSGLSHESVS